MKIITLFVLTASLASANPFGWFWGRITSIGEPVCIVDGKIAPRDDTRHRGPVCDSWELDEPGVLAAHITRAQLQNVKEPGDVSESPQREGFLNKRVEKAFPSTPAVWVSDISRTTTPMTPRVLASLDQAHRYRNRLEALAMKAGIPCSLAVHEQDRDLIGGRPDYRGDSRRVYFLQRAGADKNHRSGMAVALMLATYMSDVEESADARLTAEIGGVCRAE